jgi:GT2 family glycosyltransferase
LRTLAAEIRRRLGPAPELASPPLVSIVVLNRDGATHLRRLLAGLLERTSYPRLELIVVDNASSDDSLELLRSFEAPFPISILANAHNESFSDANNQGAEAARGELLLFLNNDIEPFEPGWLVELVACLEATRAGAVSATLIYPDEKGDSPSGYSVQSQRAWLRGSVDNLVVEPDSEQRELFDASFGEDVDSAFPIGAGFLIESELFRRIGGFTHGYVYGAEDQDLFLKVREQGRPTLYSGRTFLIHHLSSTSQKLLGEIGGPIRSANVRLFRSLWSARLWREYQLDRLAGGGLWAAPDQEASTEVPSPEQVLALGFCLKADRLRAEHESHLEALEVELERRGHRCLVLRDDAIDDPRGLFFDVAVHLRGPHRYVPQPGQLNVLWVVGGPDSVSAIEGRRYDLVFRQDTECAADLIKAALARAEQLDFPTRIKPGPTPAVELGHARR